MNRKPVVKVLGKFVELPKGDYIPNNLIDSAAKLITSNTILDHAYTYYYIHSQNDVEITLPEVRPNQNKLFMLFPASAGNRITINPVCPSPIIGYLTGDDLNFTDTFIVSVGLEWIVAKKSGAGGGSVDLTAIEDEISVLTNSMNTHNHSWDSISSKPSTFTPSLHTHDYASTTHNHDSAYWRTGGSSKLLTITQSGTTLNISVT